MLTDGPLTIDSKEGSTPDTTIFYLNGPLTLRNMFEFQAQLRGGQTPRVTIIDLSQVPYMDSAGMGLVMNQYVHCKTKGLKLIVSGANSRVMDLFDVTKVSTILPLAATVEEAEATA
ncbi:MAG: STAS domain-containing protein [Terracidiphilus sp.]